MSSFVCYVSTDGYFIVSFKIFLGWRGRQANHITVVVIGVFQFDLLVTEIFGQWTVVSFVVLQDAVQVIPLTVIHEKATDVMFGFVT